MVSDKDVCFSQDFFSLYNEMFMRNQEGYPVVKVGEHNVNILKYADDIVLIAETKEAFQQLLDIVEKESRKKGWN